MSDVEGEDEFQDAQETITRPTTMVLDTAIDEAKKSINCFFNNDFESAKRILEPWAETSMYHSLGTAVFACLEAFLTFEQQSIAKASETLKQCMNVCAKQRRHVTLTQNIGKMVKRTNYDIYTDEEVHAELCYAESLLLKAMLTFVEDETLVSFVKAGLKIRTCFLIYKECLMILKSRKWTNETHRLHFESGVRMGIGTFNLMISLLPGRVIKLLEFIGFSGDKEYGLRELKLGYNEKRGIRQVLCAITLLSYNLIATFILSHTDGDLDFCKKALAEQLDLYPNGVWFLFFKGRLEFIQGNMDESIEWYKKSWRSQELWPQFHHLCFWELMWAHCVKQEWDDALFYAIFLPEQSNWSRTMYLYQQAAIMIMRKPDSKSSDRDCINNLMMQVPTYKQRIAGKSLPMEKFVCKKSERYFSQCKNLVLPIFELMFVWNIFRVVGKRKDLIMSMYKAIEDEEKCLKSSPKTEYDADNNALLLLIKGACLRQMNHPLQAEDCLKQIIKMEKQIKEDAYLVPYAVVELAVLARDRGDIATAIALLEDAKRNYTGYSLESRLHFRIHADLLELNSKKVSNGKKIEVAEEAEEATEAILSELISKSAVN
ncbi:tetratricopeptide repeat protein 39B [Diachasma alloeum]|uniref:tetratricopeptide repeat protein 39B n=1 Tax=Diachasma alloeum TaxID=454923 RepID=UPI000738435F|nr:tetratricopeptide repeat protein 39B [Diachasma alloeum]XP_015122766.1 tetratricopeptide repeat protein 39B [Diachasma alloeum]XP_015122767.1 tetratricopeptide repeat protein 39B [Diachasma alloeum]XP_015122768.1 tetratricopeptide repeat protein 39B [Diachasma alloeum]XP_015122769.1 tetratricopeptide repeat protein 39B [Diachasma alloeum]XP_015122770.1 tetratricopeptide repeat protein 39B [Diachasma alloeum]XP_015122771.1 tetratricopeptide repeat protein 39B [Diachasma alloeum]XP_01512277